jgi:SAM-dependent methyltransferase
MMQPRQEGPLKPIVTLIANPNVQRELGLAGPQLKGVKDALEGIRASFMPKIESFQRLSEGQKREARPALMRELFANAEEALSKILRADQYRRFKQLRLQEEGIAAFLKDAVRDELELSGDQTPAIKELVQDGMRRIESLGGSGARNSDSRVAAIQDELVEGILQRLSEEQKAKWTQMIGEKFVFGDAPASKSGQIEALGVGNYDEGDRAAQSERHDFDLDVLRPLEAEQQYYLIKFLYRGVSKHYEAPPIQCLRSEQQHQAQSALLEMVKLYVESNSTNSARHSLQTYRDVLLRVSQRDATDSNHHVSYSAYVQLFPDTWWTFINYGFYDPFDPPDDSSWTETEKLWRNPVTLYHLTLSQVDAVGKDILEVGCGRGGGAAWMVRHLSPKSVHATDAAMSNVLFCQGTHKAPGLEYSHGTAFRVPRPNDSADIMVSVESFPYYRPLSAFVAECARVLRPGGKLLITGWGPPKLFRKLFDATQSHGFSLVASRDVTIGVCLSLDAFDPVAIVAKNETVQPKWLYVDMWRQVRSDQSSIRNGSTPYFTLAFKKGVP